MYLNKQFTEAYGDVHHHLSLLKKLTKNHYKVNILIQNGQDSEVLQIFKILEDLHRLYWLNILYPPAAPGRVPIHSKTLKLFSPICGVQFKNTWLCVPTLNNGFVCRPLLSILEAFLICPSGLSVTSPFNAHTVVLTYVQFRFLRLVMPGQ